MLKGLLISYYFFPCPNVASLRPYSWFNSFSEENIYLDVVTRHWSGNEKHAEDFHASCSREINEVTNGLQTIYYLPYIVKNQRRKIGNPRIRQVLDIIKLFPVDPEEKELFDNFWPFCFSLGEMKKYDFILVTSGPFTLISLASKLSRHLKIPFISDFRDTWSLSEQYRNGDIGKLTRIQNAIYRKRIAGSLKNSLAVTSVNDDLGRLILDRLKLNSMTYFTVYNGYESKLFNDIPVKRTAKFTFAVIGTIYPQQQISLILEAILKFEQLFTKDDFVFEFIGTGVYPEVKNRILKYGCRSVIVTDRIPRSAALEIMKNAQILFHCGWPDYIGISSGKIYEYIASKSYVMIAPDDQGVMKEIISKTGVGTCVNNISDALNVLVEKYTAWKKGIATSSESRNEEIVKFYTRENQASLFAKKIKKWVVEKS